MSATSVMASEVKTTSVAVMQQAAINAEEETTSSSGSVVLEPTVPKDAMTAWTFNSDLEGWEMANWPYEYNGAFDAAYDEDTQSAKVSVDFSADADKGYSKAGGISIWNDDKFDFSSLGEISFDIIVDNIDYTGDLSINIYTKNEAGDDFQLDPVIDKAAFTEVNGKYVQHVTVKAGEPSIAEAVQIAFLVVGKGTDYVGDIHFDNIALVNASQTTVETRKTWTFDNNDM